jgi:hypothetical protein
VLDVPIGLGAYWVASKKERPATNDLTAAQRSMSNTQDAVLAYTKTTTLVAVDNVLLNTPSLVSGRKWLALEDAVPETYDDRRSVLDLCDTFSNLTHAKQLWDSAFFEEKYGAMLEGLLAHPFVQDNLLGDPTRWSTLVNMGRESIDRTPHKHAAAEERQEAIKFLNAFEASSTACMAKMAKLHQRPRRSAERAAAHAAGGVLMSLSAPDASSSSSPASANGQPAVLDDDRYYLQCEYAQQTFRRRYVACATAGRDDLK